MDPTVSTTCPLRELLERLATGDPIPGGGSASALAGAMGAALFRWSWRSPRAGRRPPSTRTS